MASLAFTALQTIVRRNYDTKDCTQVSDLCPVSESIYGYRPSLPWNALFLAIFAASSIAHLIQGIHYKTWSFMTAMVIGGACEAIGQGGRLMMYNNVWSDPGFKLQIVLLTFAPAFLAAGIYLTLKHLVITFGASFSRLKPQWYTYIFISCDIFSIALQGAGGGLASAATDGSSLLSAGNNLMIAGLAFQVFTLALFGILATEYAFRVVRHKHELNPATVDLRRSMKFKAFIGAVALAYVTIMIRCVYRVIEMSGGWSDSNTVMREETLFIALDSFMISIAMLSLNAFHPGKCFENKRQITRRAKGELSNEESDMGMQESKLDGSVKSTGERDGDANYTY